MYAFVKINDKSNLIVSNINICVDILFDFVLSNQ